MSYGYSIELRTRALAYLDQGEKRQKVCDVFGISLKTLFNWIKLRERTGDVKCKVYPKVRSNRKLHKEELLAYLEKYPDHYNHEIASAFGVKASSVFTALRKFGITRKKNDTLQRKRREQKKRVHHRN